MNDIFTAINEQISTTDSVFEIKVNYYEIYNERFNDLLSKNERDGENLKLRETPNMGVMVVNDNPQFISGFEDFFEIL